MAAANATNASVLATDASDRGEGTASVGSAPVASTAPHADAGTSTAAVAADGAVAGAANPTGVHGEGGVTLPAFPTELLAMSPSELAAQEAADLISGSRKQFQPHREYVQRLARDLSIRAQKVAFYGEVRDMQFLSTVVMLAASVCVFWCLVFGVWCLVFGVWCLVFGVWCLVLVAAPVATALVT
jgi:hypothetical protein